MTTHDRSCGYYHMVRHYKKALQDILNVGEGNEALLLLKVRAIAATALGDFTPRFVSYWRAAEVLNISKIAVKQLIDTGILKSEPCGNYQKVREDVLLSYVAMREESRRKAMKDLVRHTEELGLYE